jgi:amino acid transporter
MDGEGASLFEKGDISKTVLGRVSLDSQADSSDSKSLFPAMQKNKDKKNKNKNKNNREDYGEDDWNPINNTRTDSIEYTDIPPNYDEIDNKNSIDDDIRSSVLHRILDNESLDDDLHNDKIFFNKLYNKYNTKSHNNKGKQVDNQNLEITDFDKYNKLLLREENLKSKLDKLAKIKGKNLGKSSSSNQNNVLTTLDENELNYLFAPSNNLKHWKEAENDKHFKHNKKKNVFNNMLKTFHSPMNNNSNINNKEKKDYEDYISTFSSIPIDDDIKLEDLPIDEQPFRRNNNRKLFTEDFEINNNGRFSDDIDIVVSGQEKVDYNFHKIDQYLDKDPEESTHPKSTNIFLKFLNYFNLKRIIRIQRANKYQIQRKLNVRHLHQIALGGTLGVGLLLSSGKAFTIAGPLGCLLGFIIAGFVVIATMLSFCEIMTLIPLCGGVSGIASRFVDDAFGFSLGVVYWITYMISLPTEITAGAIMLSFYKNLDIPGSNTAGWITLFFSFTLLINLFDIRVYGEFEYYSTIIKLLILLGLLIYMIVLNKGGSGPLHENIGFKYWNSNLSNITESITFGPFRPTFDVNDVGLGSLNGIGGNKGRFLQIIIASVIASYAYVGTEIVIIAGSESRNPRQAIPSATKNIYFRIVIFYLVAIFLVGLNIYSGDPRLLRYFSNEKEIITPSIIEQQNQVIEIIGGNYCESELIVWAGFSNGNQSPWVIAIQSAGLCAFASAVNAFLLYFALTAASSQLYASSRTLYFMSIQNKAPSCFSLCTKRGVPYMSVLFTASFGLLSYLSVQNNTALIFERMVSVCATAGLLVWSGMCLSFIRFYHALKLRPDIINRNDNDYPYRSSFQPYLAYLGLILGMFLVLSSGFVVFLKDEWSPLFFISSYGSLFLFIGCYLGYKIFRRSKMPRLDQIDLDSGRREIDRVIWEDEKNYTSNFKEILMKGINLLI